MKVLILLAVVVASQADVLLHHGLIGTGASQQINTRDGHGNYAFAYNEGHGSGATFRKEAGGHGVVRGSYGLSIADGRQRVVNYVADAAGFRADIKTNEPGVEPKDPAATAINKAGVLYAPGAFHHAAPLLHHGGAVAYSTAIGHHGLVAPLGLGAHHGYHAVW